MRPAGVSRVVGRTDQVEAHPPPRSSEDEERHKPGENLTRVEAQERAGLVRPSAYEVELDLTRGAEVFGSTTTVRFTGTPGASTFIDAITKTVHSVTLNGTALDPAQVSDGIRI